MGMDRRAAPSHAVRSCLRGLEKRKNVLALWSATCTDALFSTGVGYHCLRRWKSEPLERAERLLRLVLPALMMMAIARQNFHPPRRMLPSGSRPGQSTSQSLSSIKASKNVASTGKGRRQVRFTNSTNPFFYCKTRRPMERVTVTFSFVRCRGGHVESLAQMSIRQDDVGLRSSGRKHEGSGKQILHMAASTRRCGGG
ncbi:uncharacterized protein EV422DRAFT_78415 [Fimicolochytrium jonesii]|uniref:uncharacterized protein n=1 Tax=Fimicolochytrium jonesii TaxID=1396493 RepID=UPI0022FEA680|nr:uncharacterized protein EV422DRAFT_78415 [Fimicolochytrium jonesii]KAI8820093.1 hypothetical protein EV422DRAFT_78415 [Fimicolochytrium jonesii]